MESSRWRARAGGARLDRVHPPYFHDGSADTLAAVVTHYNTILDPSLTAPEQADLVEFLKPQ